MNNPMTDMERRCVDAALDAYRSSIGKLTVEDAELLRVRAVLAEAGVAELVGALVIYGRHNTTCASYTMLTSLPSKWKACDCGLDATLAMIGATQ